VRYKGLKRRAIRKKPGSKPPEYIIPVKAKRSFGQTTDYKHFWGHTIKEIAKQLPDKSVICWYTDHTLSLPVCAMRKFVKETTYCKRCPLFQKDEHATTLRSLIEEWEKDDLEEEN
jgi:hypothetical protein